MASLRRPEIKNPDQLRLMRRAGLVVARTLAAVAAAARPGVSTGALDALAAEVIRSAGATPSFLGYGADDGVAGFPGVICTSVNDEVVHGIPGERLLAAGDVLSVDCGAVVQGWHADAAVTVFVGEPAREVRALSEATQAALWRGIAALRPGGEVRDVARAVEGYVTGLATPYGVVEEYVGHGIGSAMHLPPDVPNVVTPRRVFGLPGGRTRVRPGMALAVEPMLTLGPPDNHVLDDDWTVVTDDGSPACHWEHTVAVTEHGLWVLTAEDGGEESLTALGAPYAPL